MIILLTFFIYASTLNFDYCFDDEFVIVNHDRTTKGISGIPEILSKHYMETNSGRYGYRPFTLITFALEYQFWGYKPTISHFINLIIYIITIVVLYRVLNVLFENTSYIFPLVSTLIFIVHPLHADVVSSLKNRDELLGFMGGVSSFYLILMYLKSNNYKHYIFSFLCFIIGGFSKESAYLFIGIVPLSLYFFTKYNYKKIIIATAPLIVVGLISFIIYKFILPQHIKIFEFVKNPIVSVTEISTKLSFSLYILFKYFKTLFIPYPLGFYYGYNQIPIVDWSNIQVIISFIIHSSILIYAIMGFKKKNIVSYCILFYFGTIILFSNLLNVSPGIYAVRYLYVSSLAVAILIGHLTLQLYNKYKLKRNLILYFLLSLITTYTYMSIKRSSKWKDKISLYSSDIKHLENSVVANMLYAGELANQARKSQNKIEQNEFIKQAKRHFLRAIEIYPEYAPAWNNVGSIYYTEKDYKNALKYFLESIKLDPNFPEHNFNIAKLYYDIKQYDKSIFYFKQALKNNPQYINAYCDMSWAYYKKGEVDSAIAINEKAIAIDFTQPLPYKNLGSFYLGKENHEKSLYYAEKALKINPNDYLLCYNIAKHYELIGNQFKANEFYTIADKIKNQKNNKTYTKN